MALEHSHDEPQSEPSVAEGGNVVPLPLANDGDQPWRFASDIRLIGGTEGEWLQKEIAGVVRDLLLWAHQDMHRPEAPDDRGGEQAAA
jgi:hypothetical protein